VHELVNEALAQAVPPSGAERGLIAGMNVVGISSASERSSLPDVLLAARAMYAGLDVLSRSWHAKVCQRLVRW